MEMNLSPVNMNKLYLRSVSLKYIQELQPYIL